MPLSLEQIKSLREKTGVSMQACKKALEEAKGDEAKAIEILRKKGETKALERGERSTGEGIITSYIHSNNKIGVLVQLGCETDFVARSHDFHALARDIAMQIAAMNPLVIAPEEVSPELVEKEREIWKSQLAKEGKKEAMFDKILLGKEKKFRDEISLLKQAFVKNPEVTVEKLISDAVLKLGENIKLVRFTRYAL
jgi:elongation factor Ts